MNKDAFVKAQNWKSYLKHVLKPWMPLFVWKLFKKWLSHPSIQDEMGSLSSKEQPEYEYIPEGWDRMHVDSGIKGWNIESICQIEAAKWPEFKRRVRGNAPLGINHEAPELTNRDLGSHNTVMSFAYILALAARNKDHISILDWGGGIGYYALISQAILPETEIDYYCKDVPIVCEYGRKVLPQATFYLTDSEYSDQQFDVVMASGSLQYAMNWEKTLQTLAASTKIYLYITRLPVVSDTSSYVVVQRPYSVGYQTEYLSWCLNREHFLQVMTSCNMTLVREFIVAEKMVVAGTQSAPIVSGFLFQAAQKSSARD